MKVAVIFYHKNILKIYKRAWIEKCIDSIRQQTFQNFDVFELNYGSDGVRFAEGLGRKNHFIHKEMGNHVNAMNMLFNLTFSSGYDVVFNTNMDDFYCKTRFEKELSAIGFGYDLVSSNFLYVDTNGVPFKKMNMNAAGNIQVNLERNHNVIAHPCVAMSKTFWNDGLQYNDLVGHEDLDLWKRAVSKGKKLYILPDYLLYYRIHNNQITRNYRKQ